MGFFSSSLFLGFCGVFCPPAALQCCRSPSCGAGGCRAAGGFALGCDARRWTPGLCGCVGQVWVLFTQEQLQLFHRKINRPKNKGNEMKAGRNSGMQEGSCDSCITLSCPRAAAPVSGHGHVFSRGTGKREGGVCCWFYIMFLKPSNLCWVKLDIIINRASRGKYVVQLCIKGNPKYSAEQDGFF